MFIFQYNLFNQVPVKFPGRETDSKPERIDIIARDKNGSMVVIELKAGKAGRRAIGQILGYIGSLMARRQPVRGILIAQRFSRHAIAAARPVPTLRLRLISNLRTRTRKGSR
ncbi:MAG TPA: endonuclease NucS domain-containing protein [Verrucomicrobiae bacterium]|nr:endonuclease NucS domain-containing protein [Verrucomicrobiae bacterium]